MSAQFVFNGWMENTEYGKCEIKYFEYFLYMTERMITANKKNGAWHGIWAQVTHVIRRQVMIVKLSCDITGSPKPWAQHPEIAWKFAQTQRTQDFRWVFFNLFLDSLPKLRSIGINLRHRPTVIFNLTCLFYFNYCPIFSTDLLEIKNCLPELLAWKTWKESTGNKPTLYKIYFSFILFQWLM